MDTLLGRRNEESTLCTCYPPRIPRSFPVLAFTPLEYCYNEYIMVQIAGGIIVNPERKVAIVNQFGNSWSLPKGHIERGESTLDAAFREIEEETGIPKHSLQFIRPLGSYIRSRISRDGKSVVRNAPRELHMFLFETWCTSPMRPADPDNPVALWVTPEEASELLTHPKDKEFFVAMREVHEELARQTADVKGGISFDHKKAIDSILRLFA